MTSVAGESGRGFDRTLALDLVERAAIAGLFAAFAGSLLHSALHGSWFNWLILLSEGLVVGFALIRRRARVVTNLPHEWALAAAASWGPLLVRPGGSGPLVEPGLILVLMVAGVLLQLSAKVVLARSFGLVAANRGVKRAGPYRFLRHPMYAGYVLTHVGFLLANPTVANAAIYASCLGLQVMRIGAEERLLSQDPEYRAFKAAVRWRLLPGVF